MNPILICQFYASEGAGYLAQFLDHHHYPWQYLRIDQGDSVPDALDNMSALVMMGGPMSVNDDLPWIPPLLSLIQQAQQANLPMLGHCLGGQLIAKALGGHVYQNPVREIGWGKVVSYGHEQATNYFGNITIDVFHWHGETFSLPKGAELLLSSEHCHNQAFAIGNTLAMQCHIEMTEEMVINWCIDGADYLNASLDSPAVQTAEQMQQDLAHKINQLQQQANMTYQHWIQAIGVVT